MSRKYRPASLTATDRRQQKRENIKKRLIELKDKSPIVRRNLMELEFGPYWYLILPEDHKIPLELQETDRYKKWQDLRQSLTNYKNGYHYG